MSEAVLDANVLVAWFDESDSLHARATALVEELEHQGVELVMLDVIVGEAVSVLCRRCRDKKNMPTLPVMLSKLRQWLDPSNIMWVGVEVERVYNEILDVVDASRGRLNFNDALLVVLQREGRIGSLATFDGAFAGVDGFTLIKLEDGT